MARTHREKLHFIGVCGKAMGAIAAALSEEGWSITGSDENVYEPMRGHLQGSGIAIRSPYHPRNVPPETGSVIVGKRVNACNPELLHVMERGLPHYSFPRFLHERFLHKSRNAVVAGGVGKTTTTAMLTWILEHAGLRPDYLIGGLARNLAAPARLAGSAFTVLEGDEYASCFDDRNPKFVHYRPEVAIITNIIEDHPDIYRTFDELCNAFAALVELLPRDGCLILPVDDTPAMRLSSFSRCKVISTGFDNEAKAVVSEMDLCPAHSRFRFQGVQFQVPLCGLMNVRNAAMAVLAASHFGVSPEQAAKALQEFQGIRNRQEELDLGACTLVRDKASHPRSIKALLEATRQRFPGRRVVSVLQPRATGGRDWVYQRELPEALSGFDKVLLLQAHEHLPQQARPWAHQPFCTHTLASSLHAQSVDAVVVPAGRDIADTVRAHVRGGDVVVATLLEQSLSTMDSLRAALEQCRVGG